MKMNAPTAPPAHRLPVLTEVVRLEPEFPVPGGSDLADPDPRGGVPVLMDVARLPDDAVVLAATPALPEPLPVPQAAPASPAAAASPSFVPSGAAAQAFSEIAQEAAAVAASALEEARGLPGSDLPQPPSWLRRRSADAPAVLPLPAAAPPSPLPPDFSGSWWSRDDGHVPDEVRPPAPRPAPAPAAPRLDETAVVRRVMQDLDGQIDLMFDHRLREVIAPALARAADALMADLRERLAVTVRDMVSKAVTVELSRQRRDGEGA